MVKDVVNFVCLLLGLLNDFVCVVKGKEVFFLVGCIGCYGLEGIGMYVIGVLNLIDKVWLYGFFEVIIIEMINNGCQNKMLVWKEFFGDVKIYLFIVYVYSLN